MAPIFEGIHPGQINNYKSVTVICNFFFSFIFLCVFLHVQQKEKIICWPLGNIDLNKKNLQQHNLEVNRFTVKVYNLILEESFSGFLLSCYIFDKTPDNYTFLQSLSLKLQACVFWGWDWFSGLSWLLMRFTFKQGLRGASSYTQSFMLIMMITYKNPRKIIHDPKISWGAPLMPKW